VLPVPGHGRNDRKEHVDGQARTALGPLTPGRDRGDRRGDRGRELRDRQRRELGLRLQLCSGPEGASAWGHQRSDETRLTGDALAKVTAAAKAKVPGGTIVRVETDADGNAAYEAHMAKADGTPVTVYVNKQYEVVSVQTGMPGPPARSNGASA
jgi:hypothetical protein